MTGSGALRAARRVLAAAALLLALASATFWIDAAISYDPGQYLLTSVQHATAQQVHDANGLLGFDKPVLERYGQFLWDTARGDLGISWSTAEVDSVGHVTGVPVTAIIGEAAGATGWIVLGGMLLVLLIVVPGGTLLAARAGSWADRTAILLAVATLSTHPLVLGNVLGFAFGTDLKWLPKGGYCALLGSSPGAPLQGETCSGAVDWLTRLVLPWVTFALLVVALHLRQMRASALTVLGERYVVVARAKGASERRILLRHVLPNALPPVLTSLASDIGAMLGVLLYIEVVFRIPGVGRLFLLAVQGEAGFDRPLIVGIVLLVGAAVIVGNLAADLVTGRLARASGAGER